MKVNTVEKILFTHACDAGCTKVHGILTVYVYMSFVYMIYAKFYAAVETLSLGTQRLKSFQVQQLWTQVYGLRSANVLSGKLPSFTMSSRLWRERRLGAN